MKISKQSTQRSTLRITWLCIIAIFAVSIQYQPSAALPLLALKLGSGRTGIQQSLLVTHFGDRSRTGFAPQTALAVHDAHSLLTTPKVEPMPATTEGTSLESLSIRTEVRSRRAFTALPTEVRFAAQMAPGTRKVLRRGEPGIVAVTERVTLWNSVVVDRQMLSHIVLQRAVSGIIVAAPPRNVAEAMAVTGVHRLVAVYAMVATAYTADSAQAVPTGRTATGMAARYGVVAVDPRVIPLGSRLYIQGYGTAIAADTGGAIRGNRIDLCMDSYRSAIDFGRQPVKVYVLAE